jgi:UDP-N-acetylglucosamine diphosphorylase/glucosamine-1-phosphate N-acetyltransferase
MNLILFDDPSIRTALLPFTFTRPVACIRTGILTIQEKWERRLNTKASFRTEAYLQQKFPFHTTAQDLLINGAVCPDQTLVDTIKALPPQYFLVKDNVLLAANQPADAITQQNTMEYTHPVTIIDRTWKIFLSNAAQIKLDFALITAGRTSAPITDPHTIVYGPKENIFLEEGVSLRACLLNADNGPIYLGRNSAIQEGVMVRGSFALGEGAHINMGAKIRGDSSIGPYSKMGGEVSNVVVFGYSNKAHDGFLGNAVLGEWCNLGAGTSASNMKNNYDKIRPWSHALGGPEQTELMFCGLMMGDHSKAGINTMFNTATVVDVCSNVFGAGFPPTHIPSFTWGGAEGMVTHDLSKALETANRVLGRRNVTLGDVDKAILRHIFETTAQSRAWEKM